MTEDQWRYAALAAAVVTTAIILLLTFRSVTVGRQGISTSSRNALVGADGNTSTSKFTLWLWLLLLAPGAAYLLITNAQVGAKTLADVGLDPLRPGYLVLLGVPTAAAVSAKGIAVVKAARGTSQRPVDRGGNVIRDDFGDVDLNDVQYLAFNTALLLFVGTSIYVRGELPNLPDTLVGLTSISAAGFVAGRAAASNPPSIVSATVADDGQGVPVLSIRGAHLYRPGPEPAPGGPAAQVELAPYVSVSGTTVTSVVWLDAERLHVTLAKTPPVGTAVAVTTAYGATATSKVD